MIAAYHAGARHFVSWPSKASEAMGEGAHMADSNQTTRMSIEALKKLSTRLFDHADAITNAAARNIESDIRLAAHIASDMASLRVHLKAIATACKDESTARDLRKLLGEG